MSATEATPEEKITYEKYCEMSTLALVENPSWRVGQAYFNVLATIRPDISEVIRGTMIDPFYRGRHNNDEAMTAFHQFVVEQWGN